LTPRAHLLICLHHIIYNCHDHVCEYDNDDANCHTEEGEGSGFWNDVRFCTLDRRHEELNKQLSHSH